MVRKVRRGAARFLAVSAAVMLGLLAKAEEVTAPVATESALRSALEEVTRAPGGEAEAAVLGIQLGSILEGEGRRGEAVIALRAAAVRAEAAGKGDLAAKALVAVGTNLFLLGRYDDALATGLEVLDRYGESLPELGTRAAHLAGVIHRTLGRGEPALELLRRAAELARKARSDELLVMALNEEGNALHLLGDDDRAESVKQEALALAVQLGAPSRIGDCANDLALIALARGDEGRAVRYLEQAYATTASPGSERERAISALNLSGAVASMGDTERAWALLDEALELTRKLQIPAEEEIVLRARAALLTDRGRYREAVAELDHADELRERLQATAVAQRVADLQALYEAEKREAEIQLLRQDREIQDLTLDRERSRTRLMLVGLLVAAAFATTLGGALRMRTRSGRALQEAHSRLEELVRTDPLTSLANRRHALERLAHEARRAARDGSELSLVMADLDDFKSVNDRLGHAAGDRVLVAFADVLRSSIRAVDLAARWGGEEFLLILPGTGVEGAVRVASKIRSRLSELALDWDGRKLSTTSTFGVAGYLGGDPEACLAAADGAMYRGKQAGKDRVVAAPSPYPDTTD